MTDTTVTATERKTLEKLLDAEFDMLKHTLGSMAESAKVLAREEVQRDHAKMIKTGRDGADKIRSIVRSLEDQGFEIERRGGYDFEITVKPTAVDKAIKKAEKEIDAELNLARQLTDRKRHDAKKDLMRATLSANAVALLEGLPKAADLMAEAVRETKALAR